MAECFSDPCTSTKCRNYPYAECKASFCGECTAIFYDVNGDVITNCEGKLVSSFSQRTEYGTDFTGILPVAIPVKFHPPQVIVREGKYLKNVVKHAPLRVTTLFLSAQRIA